jgi:tetratricopeptide (TPR) repeat protein
VRRAQDTLPPGHYLAGIADVRAAEALIGLDEPEKALEHADAALERSIGFRESHFTGAAHIVKAKALQSIGRVADAVEHCDAGLERLRRGGLLHDLQRALELAASLTGETRYLAEAGEVAFSMSAV